MRFYFFVLTILALTISANPQTRTAGVKLEDIDRSADPCNDFYQYANGTWRAQNPIPASMDRWSRRWQAAEANKDQLRVILDEVSKKKDWPKGSIEQLIGDHYAACMDEARVNAAGIKAIEPMLAHIAAMKNTTDVQGMIVYLHQIGIFVPFGVYASPDNHDPGQAIAYVFASGLGLPDRDYYLKADDRFKDAREKYRLHVAKMFELAGATQAQAKVQSETVFGIETQLAQASLDNVTLRDPHATDHKTAFADLRKLTPSLDWPAFFKDTGIPQAAVNVNEPKFMEEVEHQLARMSVADWKIYLKWHLLNVAAPLLSQPFVEEDFTFKGKYLEGRQEMKPRWKRCAENTDMLLGEALGRKYVERYFPPVAKARASEMVQNILLTMKETIGGLDWMGPETKNKAIEKLAKFNVKVGYPDKWKDYSKVQITRDSFWSDYLAAARFNVEDDHAQIGKPVDRSRWDVTPPTSDAYNNFRMNEIVFPAGILQPPAFDPNAADAVNYGSIGVVIGHEISHGFDDEGAKFNADGQLENWWTADDLKRFQARGQCVVNQFESYFIEPGIHHNGELVLGESIGDLGGVKIAYRAFQKAQQQHSAPTIDGFTPDQQFFIAWGQFRGDATRPETQRVMVQGDPHPVAKFRVIGPLSNFPPFQQAFRCKEGSAMVRRKAERCEVW